MESWRGLNYYTTSPTKWVHLMNLSTAEFGLGPFPPNVIAINDSLANSPIPVSLPNDTIIIENTNRTTIGSTDFQAEGVVYLSVSALAFLWATYWLYTNWGELFRPRSSVRRDEAGEEEEVEDIESANALPTHPDFISATTFRSQMMDKFYSQAVYRGVELVEKDVEYEGVDAQDVEDVVSLVQKMYETDLKIWSTQNVRGEGSAEEREALKRRSEGILGEVRRVVTRWNSEGGRWEGEERRVVGGIGRILGGNIPERRYTWTG